MILLRLSPLIPFNALDYMSGATSIPLWSYSVALIALLPGIIMYTFLGAMASSVGDINSATNPTVRIISLVFGFVFAILGVAVAAYFANCELKKVRMQYDGLVSLPLRPGFLSDLTDLDAALCQCKLSPCNLGRY